MNKKRWMKKAKKIFRRCAWWDYPVELLIEDYYNEGDSPEDAFLTEMNYCMEG